MTRKILVCLMVFVFAWQIQPVLADDSIGSDGSGEEGSGNEAWAAFFQSNGELRADVMDMGIQSMEASWMPDLPDWTNIELSAEFHTYALSSGETVLAPTATTLFFMALSPRSSGLFDSNGQMTTGAGANVQGAGLLLSDEFEKSAAGFLEGIAKALDIPFTKELADVAIAGESAWSTINFNDSLNILSKLLNTSLTDRSLFTTYLLYSQCANSPLGCVTAADQNRLLPTIQPKPTQSTQPECPAPQVIPGRISSTARKTAPNYALVVGQDPVKRGVDLIYEITISPTIYHFWTLEISSEEVCTGVICTFVEHSECVQHTQTFCEPVATATAHASLAKSSRDWIQSGVLQDLYPGAYLHHPDWRWTNGSGGCSGNTYRWQLRQERIQTSDPGYYDMRLVGTTSGTPVSPARGFDMTPGKFDVYLKMTSIIQ